jgi:hypothetical protein
MSEQAHSGAAPAPSHSTDAMPRWQRLLPRGATIAAGFTTLCCIGVSAAVSLTSAVGAGFFVKDAVLRPALVITVLITATGSAFTFRLHRNPLPILVTLGSGAWIYWFVFQATAHAGHGDHMNDHMGDTMTQPSNVVWVGLATLIAAQVYDAYLTTKVCRVPRRRAANAG